MTYLHNDFQRYAKFDLIMSVKWRSRSSLSTTSWIWQIRACTRDTRMCMKPLSAGSIPTHPRLRQQYWRRTIPWRTGEKPVDHTGRTGRILLSLFTDYQVTGKVPEMWSFSFSSVNKHRPHFQFSLLPARSCTQVVCNHRRTGRGGPNFGQLLFFWAARENLGKTSFLRRFRVF